MAEKKVKTLLRYPGGKTKAIDLITPYVKDYDKIVSPFIGGGSLEVYWSANLGKEVVGYDISGENTQQVQLIVII